MDYQIARNIRSRSLADVIAANLVAGESYTGAFTKGIKQKSVARLTRIREKFDPLNIIKFMTGGSNLAPALLGRMLGRSQRDIQYFAGTARPIGGRSTADRVGAMPAGEGGSTLSILNDMYKFMKTTHENEKKRYELLNNRREEEEFEKQRRHKELIKALGGQPTGGTTIVKEKQGSIFDSLLSMVRGMFDAFQSTVATMISSALEWIVGLKPYVGLLTQFLGNILSKLPLSALVGPAALAGFLYFTNQQKEEIEADPFNPKYDNNAYARVLRGQAKNQKQAGEQIRRETFREMRAPEIKEMIESGLTDQELVDYTGKNRRELQEWLKENPKGVFKTAPVAPLPNAPQPAKSEPTFVPPRMTPQQLESVVKENQALNLPRKPETPSVNNLMNVSQTQKNQSMIISKLDKLSVRNSEETFQRMIYYSTRVV